MPFSKRPTSFNEEVLAGFAIFILIILVATITLTNSTEKIATTDSQAGATWLAVQQGMASFNTAPGSSNQLSPPGTTPGYPMPRECDNDNQDSPLCFGYLEGGETKSNYPIGVFSAHVPGVAQGTSQVILFHIHNLFAWLLAGDASYSVSTVPGSTQVSVLPGQPVTLEWACMPNQYFYYTERRSCGLFGWGTCESSEEGTAVFSQSPFNPTAPQSSGTNFSTGGAGLGSVQVNPAVTTTYTLDCTIAYVPGQAANTSGTYPRASITVQVGEEPTAAISADSENILFGESTTIRASFAAASGDTLTQTAINGPAPAPVPSGYAWTLAPGLSFTPPTDKTFIFDPEAMGLGPGAYTFIPDVSSANYPGWNHSNNQSVVVNVSCPAHASGPTCSTCDPGYIYNGGACVLATDICSDIPGTQTTPPSGCQMPSPSPGACIPPGHTWNGSQCILITSSVELQSVSPRVRKGTNATLTWTGTSLPATCTISSSPSIAGFPKTVSSSVTGGTSPNAGPIGSATTFTIVCDSASDSTTVNILPTFQEI